MNKVLDQKKSKFSQSDLDEGKVAKSIFLFILGGTFLALFLVGGALWKFSRDLPRIITVGDYRPLGVTQVFATGGKKAVEIGEFFKERRYIVPYEKIPEHVVRAFISAEDDRFFEHPGINIASMVRASVANFRAGHVVQGGSTITQQVAKSLLLTPERSFDRKFKEIILASRIEKNLTKKQILYLYLNQIYLGHGAYGIQAASRTYFRKDVSEVTVAEAALLAGMPQAPGKYSPLLNPKRAKERQLYVLKRMMENKYISSVQMTEAGRQELKIYHDEDLNSKYAPYYVEHIRRYLVEKYGEKAVYEDGLIVSVPVDADLALSGKKSLRDGLRALDKRIGYRGPIQRLKTSEEIEKFLKEQRARLIQDRLEFQVFRSEGQMDMMQAMKLAGFESDRDLLENDEFYQAVVTGVDYTRKTALLMIGAIPAELPLAGRVNPLEPNAPRLVPSNLQKGDVILVSLSKKDPRKPNVSASPLVQVSLEQEPAVQGALFSMEVKTGKVLAMEGGYDFERSEFNRATQAARQCGSAFKPIIYASALERGFTPATVIVDSPMVFRDSDGMGSWKPNNFESKFYGDTTFRQALIKSRNIPTIKIVQAVQVPFLIQYAKRLGVTSPLNPDLSISLGSTSISLMDLTKIYSLFPRLGRKATPLFLDRVIDRDGKTLEEKVIASRTSVSVTSPSPSASPENPSVSAAQKNPSGINFPEYPLANDPDQVLDPRVAFVMSHLMKEVVTFGTGHEAKNLGRPAAGKTGTTNDYMDAWFIGFTPDVITGVWVGFDTQKTLGPGETGARAALPIWLNFMKEAVKRYPEEEFIIPPGVAFATIDPVSGQLASPNSSSAIKEAFIDGTQPTQGSDSETSGSAAHADFLKEDRD